jgi:predicted RecA/RadA family phage recombinase
LTRVDVGGDIYLVTASLSFDVVHTVPLLQRRGSRLAVALIDASQTQSGRGTQEGARVAPFSFGANRSDGPSAATNYREQAHRLSAAGARVVQLRLGTNRAKGATSQEEESATVHDVRTALSHLLDEHFTGRVSTGNASEYSTNEPTSNNAVGRTAT